MKKIIRLTESDLTRIVRRVIMEQTAEDPTALQNRLAVLYLMKSKKLDKKSAEDYLFNKGGYDNFLTNGFRQNEEYMDWLESVGLERGDVYVGGREYQRVKTFLDKNFK